jgi:hypothetical protein
MRNFSVENISGNNKIIELLGPYQIKFVNDKIINTNITDADCGYLNTYNDIVRDYPIRIAIDSDKVDVINKFIRCGVDQTKVRLLKTGGPGPDALTYAKNRGDSLRNGTLSGNLEGNAQVIAALSPPATASAPVNASGSTGASATVSAPANASGGRRKARKSKSRKTNARKTKSRKTRRV